MIPTSPFEDLFQHLDKFKQIQPPFSLEISSHTAHTFACGLHMPAPLIHYTAERINLEFFSAPNNRS
jgi:hypothetical protein